jgi:hypothetical protein
MNRQDWNKYKERNLSEDEKQVARLIEIAVKRDKENDIKITKELIEDYVYNSIYPVKLYNLVNFLFDEYGRK